MTIGSTTTTPTIKFERVVRECGHNRQLLDAKEKQGLIYDFDVLIDGVHRATMVRDVFGDRGYTVRDADGEPVKGADQRSGRTTMRGGHIVERVSRQDEFKPCILRLLDESAIPTLEQMAAARAEKAAKAARAKVQQEQEERVYRVQQAGVDLYEAAKASRTYLYGIGSFKVDPALLETLNAALAKAEG